MMSNFISHAYGGGFIVLTASYGPPQMLSSTTFLSLPASPHPAQQCCLTHASFCCRSSLCAVCHSEEILPGQPLPAAGHSRKEVEHVSPISSAKWSTETGTGLAKFPCMVCCWERRYPVTFSTWWVALPTDLGREIVPHGTCEDYAASDDKAVSKTKPPFLVQTQCQTSRTHVFWKSQKKLEFVHDLAF